MMLEAGRQIRGKYRLERELASGGMGALWVAHDRMLRRRVAIKFLHSMMAGSPTVRARFDQEACTAAQIKSPHVVETYDSGTYRGLPFIVLELLEGEDLRTRLEHVERLGYPEALKIFCQILKALAAVHSAGVVHRDLKPGNIFLAQIGGEELVKILDFGVARAVDLDGWLEATRSGQVLGTPKYMSPEQVKGVKAVDARSDLWSVAVILYRVLTGTTPFVGRNVADLLSSICYDEAPPPSEIVADLPSGVDAFFQRALAKEPTDRFQSAHEMLGALVAMGSGDFDSRRRAITLRLGPIWDKRHEHEATTARPPVGGRIASAPEIEISTSDGEEDWTVRATRCDGRGKAPTRSPSPAPRAAEPSSEVTRSQTPASLRSSAPVPNLASPPEQPPPLPRASAKQPPPLPRRAGPSKEALPPPPPEAPAGALLVAREALLPPPLPVDLTPEIELVEEMDAALPEPRRDEPRSRARAEEAGPVQAPAEAARARPVEPGRESAEPFPLVRPRQTMDTRSSLVHGTPPPRPGHEVPRAATMPPLATGALATGQLAAKPMRWGAWGLAALLGASLIIGAAWLGSTLDIARSEAPASSLRTQGP